MIDIVFYLEINNLDSLLTNLKIYNLSKFGTVTRSMTEIHFKGWENEEERSIFIFFRLGSWRK
jgi:hypothetical protein